MAKSTNAWKGVLAALRALMPQLKNRTEWRGFFRVYSAETGELVAENEILSGGVNMTMELWAGDSTETFAELRLEDIGNNAIATETITTSYSLDQTSPPIGKFVSTALFSSGQVSSPVAFVVLLGSAGREIARAPLALAAGNAYEIKREDYLGEAASVT